MTGFSRDTPEGSELRPRSDSSEPWDERPDVDAATTGGLSKNNNNAESSDTMRRNLYELEEQELEDGDLPPLNLSRSRSGQAAGGPNSISGHAVSTANLRTLNPDMELMKQREFWKQLDPASGSLEDEAPERIGHKVDQDYPSDDLNSSHPETREESRHRMPTNTSRGDSDYIERIRMAESEESDDSRDSKEYIVEQEETNFCDHTLSAIEVICGESPFQTFCGGGNSQKTPESVIITNPNISKKAKNLNLLNARGEADAVDEHTAIEVEYVEPVDTSAGLEEKPENWSPSRKNAYLAAMARKAKADFEKTQTKELATVSSKSKSSPPLAADTDNSAEDVYNSFNAAEKRKFLRLINSGLTSTESANRVRAERSAPKGEKQGKKGKLFKFWKKAGSKSKASPLKKRSAQEDLSFESTTPHQEEKKEEFLRPITETADDYGYPVEEKKEEYQQRIDEFTGDNFHPPARAVHRQQDIASGEDKSTNGEIYHQATPETKLSHEYKQMQSASASVSSAPITPFSGSLKNQSDEVSATTGTDLNKSSGQDLSMDHQPSEQDTASSHVPTSNPLPLSSSATAGKIVHAIAHVGGDSTAEDGSIQEAPTTKEMQQRHHDDSTDVQTVANASFRSKKTDVSKARTVSARQEGMSEKRSTAKFAKSGINYYDAVRRDLSESDDDETTYSSSVATYTKTKPHRNTLLGPILQSPKLKGFSKLSRKESKYETKATTPPASKIAPAIVTPNSDNQLPLSDTEEGRMKTSPDVYQKSLNPFETPPGSNLPYPQDLNPFQNVDVSLEEEKTEIDAVSPDTSLPHDYNMNNQVMDMSTTKAVQTQSDAEILQVPQSDPPESPNSTGIAEEEALGRVERELLRPVGNLLSSNQVDPQVGRIFPVSAKAKDSAASKISEVGEKTPNVALTPPISFKDDSDFNMNEYLTSTDAYSHSGQGNDTMSVMSYSTSDTSLYGHGSVYTQSSALTQSSRKRRPGAAKQRLAKAKAAEKQAPQKAGWHESIKAAAETTNRVWKPNVGWVDYQEPEESNVADLSKSEVSSEKIHLNLSIASKQKNIPSDKSETLEERTSAFSTHHLAKVSTGPTASQMNSDDDGEKATNQRLLLDDTSDRVSQSMADIESFEKREEQHDKKPPQFSLDDMSIEQSVAHSVEQFVQSVDTASPARPSRRRTVASPSRAIRSPPRNSGWVDSMRAATANIAKEGKSWDPKAGWAQASRDSDILAGHFDPPSMRYEQDTIEERNTEVSDKLDSESEDNDPNVPSGSQMNADKKNKEARTPVSVVEKWSEKVGKSVKRHSAPPHEYAACGLDEENAKAPLLENAQDFSGKSITPTPTVNVVKEKVDESEMSWFPTTRRGSSTTWEAEPQNLTLQQSVASSSRSSASPRRSSGPVDVDEAENLPDEEEGVVWDGVVFEKNTSTQCPEPDEKFSLGKPAGESQVVQTNLSGSSVASLTSFSKSVPRLARNKKDTSPIRAGKQALPETSPGRKAPYGIMPIEESRRINVDAPPNDKERMDGMRENLAYGVWSLDDGHAEDESTQSSGTASIVKLRAQQFESMNSKDVKPSQERSRANGESSRLNSATAEWKSFLVKKVRAENVVAAEQGGNTTPDYGPSLAYVGGDSVFDFSATDGGASVNTPDQNGANNAKDRNQGEEVLSVVQGSDFSDGNEINKSFLGRLAGCAAPMMPKRVQNGSADALAHLTFLKTKNMCGRPDVILEESSGGEEPKRTKASGTSDKQQPIKTNTSKSVTTRQLREVQTKSAEVLPDTRSVISEDFGAKTAYLEALAMKTAVSKPRRNGDSRRRDRWSAASDISSSSARSHKEKWKDFLERKSRTGASPGKSRSTGSEASTAAESYAARKVDEMMAVMASRSKSTPRNWRSSDRPGESKSRVVEKMIQEHTNSSRSLYDLTQRTSSDGKLDQALRKTGAKNRSASLVAAEELASARVNAMMQALASNNAHVIDEGEI